ncbi:Protein MAIN-LIKE 1 [Glycine max]|nr:Protein MAIN-LIKE 1 [Glycine max]
MLGAPSIIAGAPSNLLKGQFCPSFKNIKNFFPLSEAFRFLSSAKKLFSSLLSSAKFLGGLLLREASPASSSICIREDAGKNGGSLVTVSLLEDPLGVLLELPEEDLPEDFRKKGSSGGNETTSRRTGLPESSRNTSSGMFPETFRKRVFPDDLLVVPEALSGRPFFRKGRAIGRVVGRDRPADEDAGDVPERRRPTASARRLHVHQMTTEGRDMAEDVADMTDDVPEQPTEAPEMRADAQGADSGEGSDGDDAAEGFAGGPRDPSVLTSFAEHVAHAVWSGQERPDLKLVSHGRKVTLIGRPVPEIEGMVAATGLSPLIDCSVITGDPRLISAFVERWHSETSTFHLPVGELTITLDDVSSILHLPITGALHSFHALSTEEARFLLTELLGGYAWGVATLVHMYDQLDEACRTTTRQLAGYLTLLQCWIYEHFPSVHQCVIDDTYQETSPRASRWLTSKAHMKGITGAPYRARCDGLTVTDVS